MKYMIKNLQSESGDWEPTGARSLTIARGCATRRWSFDKRSTLQVAFDDGEKITVLLERRKNQWVEV